MDNHDEPLYMIGVVARIANIHPQTLRLYEREKLIVPKRSGGDTRLYSDNDIELIKEIQHLTQELGLNLAGVKAILRMRKRVAQMEEEIKHFEDMIDGLKRQMAEEIKKVHDSYCKNIVLYNRSPLVVRHSSKKSGDSNY